MHPRSPGTRPAFLCRLLPPLTGPLLGSGAMAGKGAGRRAGLPCYSHNLPPAGKESCRTFLWGLGDRSPPSTQWSLAWLHSPLLSAPPTWVGGRGGCWQLVTPLALTWGSSSRPWGASSTLSMRQERACPTSKETSPKGQRAHLRAGGTLRHSDAHTPLEGQLFPPWRREARQAPGGEGSAARQGASQEKAAGAKERGHSQQPPQSGRCPLCISRTTSTPLAGGERDWTRIWN